MGELPATFVCKWSCMNRQYPFLIFIGLYIIAVVFLLYDYIPYRSLQGQLGLVAFLFTLQVNPAKRGGCRYAWVALALAVLACWLPVKTVVYASLICALFFAMESFAGRLPLLSLLALVLSSPVFEYMLNVFSFPIRLQLTAWVGQLLVTAGMAVQITGNTISYNGFEFSVDPACMGLHMLTVSFLAGLMLVTIYQKTERKRLGLRFLLLYFLALFGCNLLCNLFRMLCLIYFVLLPDTPMHTIAGLLCFGVYVLLPAGLLSRWMVRRWGVTAGKDNATGIAAGPPSLWLRNALVACIVIAAGLNARRLQQRVLAGPVISKAGYTVTQLPGAVTQLQNKEVLVYLKAIGGFYTTEHHPMLCWRGSGYEFRKVQERQLPQHTVYTAVLEKKGELLYTAWWYTNGQHATTSQLQWRWNVLRGARDYTLVNITAATPAALEAHLNFSL